MRLLAHLFVATLMPRLGRAVAALLVALLALMVLLAAAETAAWGLFSTSWASAAEVQGLLAIWFALLGAAYGIREGLHLGIDALARLLPAPWKRTSDRLAAALIALFGVLLATYGTALATRVTNTLPATGLPAAVQYLPALVGGVLMALFAVESGIRESPPSTTSRNDDSATE